VTAYRTGDARSLAGGWAEGNSVTKSPPTRASAPVPVVGSVRQGESHDQRCPLSPVGSKKRDVHGNEARQTVGMPPGVRPLRRAVFILRAEVAHAESADLLEDDCAERWAGRRRGWPHQLLGQHQSGRFACGFACVERDLQDLSSGHGRGGIASPASVQLPRISEAALTPLPSSQPARYIARGQVA
jgi:hypothetical protein